MAQNRLVDVANKVADVFGVPKLSHNKTLAYERDGIVYINDRVISSVDYDTLGASLAKCAMDMGCLGLTITLEDILGVINDETYKEKEVHCGGDGAVS